LSQKAEEKEAGKFKWPVTIAIEINTFFETHDWEVNITAMEEQMIKEIPDQ